MNPRPDHYAGTTLAHGVERGQVWASTHSGDVHEGKRQRRLVTEVEKDYAWLQTEGREGLDGSTRVKLRNGKIKGHRLVEPAPPLAHEKRCEVFIPFDEPIDAYLPSAESTLTISWDDLKPEVQQALLKVAHPSPPSPQPPDEEARRWGHHVGSVHVEYVEAVECPGPDWWPAEANGQADDLAAARSEITRLTEQLAEIEAERDQQERFKHRANRRLAALREAVKGFLESIDQDDWPHVAALRDAIQEGEEGDG